MPPTPGEHLFHAVAFAEKISLKEANTAFPEGKRTGYELQRTLGSDGELFLFPFGAAVFHNVPAERRQTELAVLRESPSKLATAVIEEEFTVREAPGAEAKVRGGELVLDQLTPARAGCVALIVAQSAAMEYYEAIVEDLFSRTRKLVHRLEKRGTVPYQTRPMHRFIGEAISIRTTVLAVLHLLDRPDVIWDDPVMDRIYADLQSEFDLGDRFRALEMKLKAVQDALELIIDVARDRRLVFLEAAIVVLIMMEIVLTFTPLR